MRNSEIRRLRMNLRAGSINIYVGIFYVNIAIMSYFVLVVWMITTQINVSKTFKNSRRTNFCYCKQQKASWIVKWNFVLPLQWSNTIRNLCSIDIPLRKLFTSPTYQATNPDKYHSSRRAVSLQIQNDYYRKWDEQMNGSCYDSQPLSS